MMLPKPLQKKIEQTTALREQWKQDRLRCSKLTKDLAHTLVVDYGMSCREAAAELGVSGQYILKILVPVDF